MQAIKEITCIIGILIFGMPILPVIAVPEQNTRGKSFEQWCQEKRSLPVVTIKTIDVLLRKAMISDCQIKEYS
jgi:hypothetical protein